MWKKLGLAVIVLVIIVAGGMWLVTSDIEQQILASIEKNGSASTSTKVTVGSVALSLLSGQCVISGLTVGNPPGFSTPYALALGTITIHAELGSVIGKGPLIVDLVTIDGPHIFYEIRAGTTAINLANLSLGADSNLGTLAQGARSNASNPGNDGVHKEIIKQLLVENSQVSIATTLLKGKQLTENLAVIRLTGIGAGTGGATTGQVSAQVLTAITNQAALTGATALVKAVGSAATLPLGNAVVNKLKSLL